MAYNTGRDLDEKTKGRTEKMNRQDGRGIQVVDTLYLTVKSRVQSNRKNVRTKSPLTVK